jgi:transposase
VLQRVEQVHGAVLGAVLVAGHDVVLVNPLRNRRFPDEGLERTKTDAMDALRLARFAARFEPPPVRTAGRSR